MANSNLKVIQSGNEMDLTKFDQSYPRLPVGHYSLNMQQMRGFYFVQRDPFKLPDKIYGNPEEFVQRILTTFKAMGRGMGVLLSGDKGTGKTVTAKMLCNQADMPTIMFNSGFSGQGIMELLEDLEEPCIIFIDEFEKLYGDEESRNFFLTLLDGTATSKHLFVLTTNTAAIGQYLIGRPGRIRYHKQFVGVDEQMLQDIVDDNIADPKLNAAVKHFCLSLANISFDALTSIVEEAVMFNEDPKEFIEFFNVTPEVTEYKVVFEMGQFQFDEATLNEIALRRDVTNSNDAYSPKMVKSFLNEFTSFYRNALKVAGETHDGALATALQTMRGHHYDHCKTLAQEFGSAAKLGTVRYSRIGVDTPIEMTSGEPYIDLYQLREEEVAWDAADVRSFCFDASQIQSIKREGKAIVVQTSEGTLTATPMKKVPSHYGPAF